MSTFIAPGCADFHLKDVLLCVCACVRALRQKRLAEWKSSEMKNVFGEVMEISGQDYVKEVNKAGEDIWVVLHLYKQG